jgi:hypothetical protein
MLVVVNASGERTDDLQRRGGRRWWSPSSAVLCQSSAKVLD